MNREGRKGSDRNKTKPTPFPRTCSKLYLKERAIAAILESINLLKEVKRKKEKFWRRSQALTHTLPKHPFSFPQKTG